MKKKKKTSKKKALKPSRKRPARWNKDAPDTSVPGTGVYISPGMEPLLPPD